MTDVDELDRMTGGELQTVREYLGLTLDTLAARLEVRQDTLRKWEAGKDGPIPYRVRTVVEELEDHTALAVGDLVAALQDARDPAVAVYRRTEDMPADRPDLVELGARWWRHVVARAATEVPGVAIGTRAELEAAEDRGPRGTTLDQARQDLKAAAEDLPVIVERHRHLGMPCSRVLIARDADVAGGSVEVDADVVQAADLAEWLEGLTDADDPDMADPDDARELARRIIAGENTWDDGPAGEMALHVTVLWRDVTV